MKNRFVVLFIFGLFIRVFLSLTYFTKIPTDALWWYPFGVATLVSTFGENSIANSGIVLLEKIGISNYTNPYEVYTFGGVHLANAYPMLMNYFFAFLVLLSGYDYGKFSYIFLSILILVDIVIVFLIQKILIRTGIEKSSAEIYSLFYFLHISTIVNLRLIQLNTFLVLFLLLAIYYSESEVKSAVALGISVGAKIVSIFSLPFFLIRSKNKIKFLLPFSMVLLFSFFIGLKTPYSMINGFLRYGRGYLYVGLWNPSYSNLFRILLPGYYNQYVATFFILFMFLFFILCYYYLKNEDISIQILVLFTIYFLFFNFIHYAHFTILTALLALNLHRSNFHRKIAVPYFIIPIGWFFVTENSIGSRIFNFIFGLSLDSIIPYSMIMLVTNLLLNLVVSLILIKSIFYKTQ